MQLCFFREAKPDRTLFCSLGFLIKKERYKRCPLLPIFPDSRPSSIVGTMQLNFCVRYGNRWTLHVNETNSFVSLYSGQLILPLCSHLPIFPDSRPSSIVGTTQLNFCVRYGNRWTLRVNDTNYGAPSGIRTRDPLIKSQLLYQLS